MGHRPQTLGGRGNGPRIEWATCRSNTRVEALALARQNIDVTALFHDTLAKQNKYRDSEPSAQNDEPFCRSCVVMTNLLVILVSSRRALYCSCVVILTL